MKAKSDRNTLSLSEALESNPSPLRSIYKLWPTKSCRNFRNLFPLPWEPCRNELPFVRSPSLDACLYATARMIQSEQENRGIQFRRTNKKRKKNSVCSPNNGNGIQVMFKLQWDLVLNLHCVTISNLQVSLFFFF